MKKSIQVLATTGTQFNIISEKVRGDAFYGFTDGFHTIAFYLSDFVGKIYVEGTLATNPNDNDWFRINLNGNFIELDYTVESRGNNVQAFTFEGNFVYIRAGINRSHLLNPDNNNNLEYGQIIQVLLNH